MSVRLTTSSIVANREFAQLAELLVVNIRQVSLMSPWPFRLKDDAERRLKTLQTDRFSLSLKRTVGRTRFHQDYVERPEVSAEVKCERGLIKQICARACNILATMY